ENDFENKKVLKGTREGAKIVVEEPGEDRSILSFKNDPIKLGEFGSLGDSDLMAEILTAVAGRKNDEVGQEIAEVAKKPKRTVSFKNQPPKLKNQSKKKPAPLPSESESSEEESPVVTGSDEGSSDEGSNDETSIKNSPIKAMVKSGRGNKDVKMKSLPLNRGDSEEGSDSDDQQRMASPPYSTKQTYGNDLNRRQPRSAVEEAARGRKEGKKPIKQLESEDDESTEHSISDKEEAKTESEDESEKIPLNAVRKKSLNNNQNEYSEKGSTDLNVNLSALTINPAEDSVTLTESKEHQVVAKKETKTQESTTSEEETSEDDTVNRTRKEEPLAVYVEEVGQNSNYQRTNFNTRPRSVSPNYNQGQRWIPPPGPGGHYMENSGYPIDNRRSMMQVPYRGGEYYDDDRSSVASFGGHSRSAMGLAPMTANRRRISGGNADYARDLVYLDDGYYDDRGSHNHIRPQGLFSLPQSQLSAREQELMARETGAPLINLPEKQKDPQTGLVGAITAREHQRKTMVQGMLPRNAELERERALERERDRRLAEQRQQMMMVEREREPMYPRQSYIPPPSGQNRFYNNQQFLDPAVGQRGSYYDQGYYGPADDEDEDDDVPLGVGGSVSSLQPRSQQVTRGRRKDIG
ncbi:13449_t:CDS:2, partial [Acaulospora colombiana]